MTNSHLTKGTIFIPDRQYEDTPYLALKPTESGYLCVRINCSSMIDQDCTGLYDVLADDGGIYQMSRDIVLPPDSADSILGKLRQKYLEYMQTVHQAYLDGTKPQRDAETGLHTGNPVYTKEYMVQHDISKSSQRAKRNQRRLNFAAAEQAVHEHLERNWQNSSSEINPPIKVWDEPDKPMAITGKSQNLTITLQDAATLLLQCNFQDTPPVLHFSSSEIAFWLEVDWQKEKNSFHFSFPLPEFSRNLLLSGNDWGIVIVTEMKGRQNTLVKALFSASRIDYEDYCELPDDLWELRQRHRKGVLEYQSMIMAASQQSSLVEKAGHLATLAVACDNLSDKSRWQLCRLVEHIINGKISYEPIEKSRFWKLGQSLITWQENNFTQQESWFAKQAHGAWHQEMEQQHKHSRSFLFDAYPPEKLEKEAFGLMAEIKRNLWNFQAKEAICAMVRKLHSVELPSIESYMFYLKPDDYTFSKAADSGSDDTMEFQAVAFIFDKKIKGPNVESFALSNVRAQSSGGYYRYTGEIDQDSIDLSNLTLSEADCRWLAGDKDKEGTITLNLEEMTFKAEFNLDDDMASLPGKAQFRFIFRENNND